MTPDLSLRLDRTGGGALRLPDDFVALPTHRLERYRLAPRRGLKIGVIRNAKARRNIDRAGPHATLDADCAMPLSYDELHRVLATFARDGISALVINGGDGTVRDVLTAAARYFHDGFPRIALVPSGKTNALGYDLNIPKGWTEQAAIEALRAGRVEQRAPLEIWRSGARHAEQRGFIFGAGAFVRATALAQDTHRLGAFNGLAVGLSVAGAIAQTIFAGGDNVWRRGTRMRIAPAHANATDGARYLLFGSTLHRLPLDIRPFGRPRAGLKTLTIDAPPARLARALPSVLAGYDLPPGGGYRRDDGEAFALAIDGDFILDGETFAGGDMILRHGAPIRFAVP
ncbi:diacylglycerol kinase family protein [Sphingomonas sp.]|jgi:hypothetical protein|uniref:diacylglycerol kinase family protein n=1 Tax=Sphingomonas sp. TaxID=28214 RepID=UPI002ED9A123